MHCLWKVNTKSNKVLSIYQILVVNKIGPQVVCVSVAQPVFFHSHLIVLRESVAAVIPFCAETNTSMRSNEPYERAECDKNGN